MPHGQQAGVGQFQPQMIIEDRDDLRRRVSQRVVQPGRECQRAVAQFGLGQRFGNFRFDVFFAARTPIAVNDVPRDLRLQIVRDVFGVAFARFAATVERPAAIGTGVGPVFPGLVEFGRCGAATSRLPRLLASFLRPLLRRSFQIGRRLAGRRRRRDIQRHPRLLFAQQLRLFQQREDHGFFPQRINPLRRVPRQIRPQRNIQCRQHPGILATRNRTTCCKSEPYKTPPI